MVFDKKSYDIIIFNGDYGVGLSFTIDGIQSGDEIVFCFESKLADKTYISDGEEFTFLFNFTENESDVFSHLKYYTEIPYSIKHKRNGVLLATLLNANLVIKRTVTIDG